MKARKAHRRELLFSVVDFEWEFFRAGGKGGQKQNKSSTGARVRHKPSGAVAEAREHRTQLENRRAALRKLSQDPLFKGFCRDMAAGLPDLQKRVDEQMRDENLLVEYGESFPDE